MAEGTLWLLTDQTASAAPYVAWVRRRMVRARRVVHQHVGQLPIRRPVRQMLSQLQLSTFDPAADRILLVLDWEDDAADPAVRSARGRATQDARDVLADRFEVEAERVQAYLVPPTTEGWYLLVARQDPDLRRLLLAGDRVNQGRFDVVLEKRWEFACRFGAAAPTVEEVYACLGGAGRPGRKKALAGQVAGHLGSSDATLVEVEALPPCLKGIARWLAEWG
jgi:hypothetical protein